MYKLFLKFLLLPVLLLSGCTESPRDFDGLTVYTGFYTMYDFTEKIGGDKINLVDFVPAGSEPHDWEPSPGDILKLEKASLLVVNGNGMEPWLEKVTSSLQNKDLIILETSNHVNIIEMGEDNDAPPDPHVWLDPLNAKKQLEAIKNTLAELDPTNGDYYENNFKTVSARIDQLDGEFQLAAESFVRKDLILPHGAFSYLCRRYGLNQIALEGAEGDGDILPSRMIEVVDLIKNSGVKYIFNEPLEKSKAIETISGETGAEILILDPIESTLQGTSGPEDYFERMEENLSVLKKALN